MKKGRINEEDISNLLHRYPAQKLLTLLQEVSQSADAKMDWNALVKKTATGITNSREYQMLWRHIAYCAELLDKVDDDAQPLDDDSDLEYELEVYPPVSTEATAEAAACVKVLIGSGLPGDSKVPHSSTVEAPLTINKPNGHFPKSSLENTLPASVQGPNSTVPVSVQKPPVPQGCVQKQPVPARATGENSRKRKPWTEEEDLELQAVVQKCGEGNWQNILKDYKGDRTKPQLCQRWGKIRKRESNLSIGAPSTVGNGSATTSNPSTLITSNKDNATVNNTHPQPQQSSKPETSPSARNSRAPPKKAPLKQVIDSSMVTKVAVAAGARIASPSNAASLYKVAQANNAVHIMTKGGSSLIKSSVNTSTSTKPTHLRPNLSTPLGSQSVRPNLVRPTTTPPSSSSVPISNATGSVPVRPNLVRPTTTPPSSSSAPISNATGSVPVRPNLVRPTTTPPSSSSVPISNATGSVPVRPNLVRPTTTPPPPSSVPISNATGSVPVRSTFVVLPSPSSIALTSATKPNNPSARVSQASQVVTADGSSSNKVEVKKEGKNSEVMKAPPPPHPLARPVPTKNSEVRQKPSAVPSSTGVAAPSQAAARENSQCSVITEKGKSGYGNSKDSAPIQK